MCLKTNFLIFLRVLDGSVLHFRKGFRFFILFLYLFQAVNGPAVELDFEEIFELGIEGGDPLFDLRHYFYPECEDPHIRRLSAAASVAEVLSCVAELDSPTNQHLTQVIVMYPITSTCGLEIPLRIYMNGQGNFLVF